MESAVFLGTNYDDPDGFGEYSLDRYDDTLAMAISVGGQSGCHPYTDLNEDSCMYAVQEDFKLLAVVDAHSGAFAGTQIIQTIKENAENLHHVLSKNFDVGVLKQWMVDTILPVSENIAKESNEKPFHRKSKTQLSMVISSNDDLLYAQFGDTRIYSTWKTDGNYSLSPVINSSTLGYPMNEEDFLSLLVVNKIQWTQPGAVIVCSDGFPEAKYPEYSSETVIAWTKPYTTARDICENLMESAFDLGACDNLSVVALVKK